MKATDFVPEILSPYDPRHLPKIPPAAGIFDYPTVQVCINSLWVSHVDGVLERLLFTDAWIGTDDEIHTAILQIRALLSALGKNPGNCPVITDVRQNSGSPCILEKNNGTTWVQFANLQLCPPKLRLNNGVIEWDNGSGWTPLPNAGDERYDGSYTPPWPDGSVPSGQTAECLSAENIVSIYKAALTQVAADIAVGLLATGIAEGILLSISLFIPVVLIGALCLAAALAAYDLGAVGVADLLTDDQVEKIRCNLNCHAESDGSFTTSGYNAFYAQLSTDFSGPELTYVQNYFNSLGPVGLSRQGAANGITSADCDDCGCEHCYTFDFRTSDCGWSIGAAHGVWVDGQGWTCEGPTSGILSLRSELSFSPSQLVTTLSVTYTTDALYGDDSDAIRGFLGGTTQRGNAATEGSCANVTNHTVSVTGAPVSIDRLMVALDTSLSGCVGTLGYVSSVTIYGPNEFVFGADNC